VIEGEPDRTPHSIRDSLRNLTNHFAADRIPEVVKQ